ncbi:MAG: hypothetical protein ACTSX6_07445 [Candidatus Heimdallarchaeaceae archaeon]
MKINLVKNETEMALNNEDLWMIILGAVMFVLSFTDIRSGSSISWISFPIVCLFLVSWGIARFRRRPLPKQILYKRNIYLSILKVVRNQNIIAIIVYFFLVLVQYISIEDAYSILPIVYNFISLFVVSLVEFAGNVTISDSLEVFQQIKGEEEHEFKKKRFKIIYGTKFWIWLSFTFILSAGLSYLPYSAAFLSKDILIILVQFLSLFLGLVLFAFLFWQILNYQNLDSPSMIMKAVDYYNSMELTEWSYRLLEDYVNLKDENIALMSKLSLMYIVDKEFDKALSFSDKILKETEEKNLNVPHIISKAYLVRALGFKGKEKYEEAYKAVTRSLKFVPENKVARKLRRDLRNIIKSQKFE